MERKENTQKHSRDTPMVRWSQRIPEELKEKVVRAASLLTLRGGKEVTKAHVGRMALEVFCTTVLEQYGGKVDKETDAMEG